MSVQETALDKILRKGYLKVPRLGKCVQYDKDNVAELLDLNIFFRVFN